MSTFVNDPKLTTEHMYVDRKPTGPVKVGSNTLLNTNRDSNYLITNRDSRYIKPLCGRYKPLENINGTTLTRKAGRVCTYYGAGTTSVSDGGRSLLYSLGVGSKTFSMNVLFTRLTGSNQYFMSRSLYGPGADRYYIGISSESLVFDVVKSGAGILRYSASNLPVGRWVNIQGVIDRDGLMELRVEGVTVASLVMSVFGAMEGDAPFYLGGYGNAAGTAPQAGIGFDGYMESFMIIDKALSKAESLALARTPYHYLEPDIGA